MSKKSITPEEKIAKKKKRSKRAKKVLAGILAVIVILAAASMAVTAIGFKSNMNKAKSFPSAGVNCRFTPENEGNGEWSLRTDGDLKVVQLTDVHLGGGWMSTKKDAMSLNAVAAMLSAEKPDFVIVTGDVAYPVPFQAGTFNNKHGANLFAELMETLGIYWTMGFGNHDTEAYSYFSREEITEFYSSGNYPHCLLTEGAEGVDGSGNQIFKIVNSDNIVTRALFVLDSHSYIDGDIFGIQWKYDNLHDNQIKWYSDSVKALASANAEAAAKLAPEKAAQYKALTEVVPSSMFMHIPLTEYKDAWNEYLDNGRKDTENVKLKYGTVGESGNGVYCGIHEDDMFETMQALGSTDTVFCGHDHLNNFSLNYKGINLTYGMSVDYLAYIGIYKLGSQRGCTVLDIAADGTIDWHAENYYQDKYTSFYEKEPVEMQKLEVEERK